MSSIMFILFFLVFTLIFTLFENLVLAGISLLLVGVVLTIYQLISHKKILTKKMLACLFLAFFLATGAFGIKERRYYDSDEGVGTRNKDLAPSPKSLFIGTGMISDLSNKGKYVFTAQGTQYLLYSKKEYQIGDQLWLVGKFTPPAPSKIEGGGFWKITPSTFNVSIFSGGFDYAKRLKMKGRRGTIYETNSLHISLIHDKQDGFPIESGMTGPQSNSPIGVIKSMKKSIQEKVIQAYGKNKISGLILGMLIGDKSQIPESEYQFFINSGLVHLIAVSGGNILMIVVFLQCVLCFLPFYIRLGVILLTIIGYSLICGMDSSVFRAVLMGGLSMVALFRGREISVWRLLSLSCIIMLSINPYFLAYDVGFLLSYSALIGLIYFNDETNKRLSDETKNNKNRLQKIIVYIYKNYLSPSIGASIGIFPIIIFFMGKINLLGVIGNVLVLPIVPFVMIYGFVSVWLYQFFGRSRLLWIEKILVQYIYNISEILSQFGLYISVTGLRCKYAFLFVCLAGFVYRRYKRRRLED